MDKGKSETQPAVTHLLQQWREGDADAMEQLAPWVYKELQRQASIFMKKERHGHTLTPTDLVHETFLKMVGERNRDFRDRIHFFALAARVM